MHVGLCTISNKEASAEDVIEHAGAAGYDGIELWGRDHAGDGSSERCGRIHTAAREAGRSPDDVTVRPQVLAAVGSDPEAGRALVRQFVANYVGRKEAYRAKIGDVYPDTTARVAEAWDRDPDEAVELVTDEMVDDLGVAGRPAAARDRLRDLVAHPTVDAPIVFVPKQADAEMLERTVEELAPERL
jgi:alkanesulfonate monooxygenase SsuD/methylene tetrahydromethanopterin reductase-like flavin-dependent oxidoreductase (luciferase family)